MTQRDNLILLNYVDGEILELDGAITLLETDINNFSSDLKLTLAEANSIKLSLENVTSESTDIIAIAASLAITTEKNCLFYCFNYPY